MAKKRKGNVNQQQQNKSVTKQQENVVDHFEDCKHTEEKNWFDSVIVVLLSIINYIANFFRTKHCCNCSKHVNSPHNLGIEDDQPDARSIHVADAKLSQFSEPLTPTAKTAKMVTAKHDDVYNMNHKNRGKAIIFNHQYFDNHLSVRLGTDVDAERLQKVLKVLNFDVQLYQDLDFSEIKNAIKDLTEEDHGDSDCVLIAVLTHGMESSQISAKDVFYPVSYLWEPLTDCLSLAGKPKLFIINACKGNKVDVGIKMKKFAIGTTVTDATPSNYKLPKQADFLLAYSTVEGYYSYRSPTEGTWFIQCLTEVLQEYHRTTDLLKMLTMTARKVAVDFTSYNPKVPEMHEMTQVPSVSSKLLRDVYFYPKSD